MVYSECLSIIIDIIYLMVRSPIWVSEYTKKRLKSIAVSDDESYESILTRLLDCKSEDLRFDYLICKSDSCCVKVCVDWGALEENLSFYTDDDVLVDEFPVNVNVSSDVWLAFKEDFESIPDIFEVLSVLDEGTFTVFDGLRIFRL